MGATTMIVPADSTSNKPTQKFIQPKGQIPSSIYDRSTSKSYRTGKLLGKGAFAKVYLITDLSTGVLYADKMIDKAVFQEKKQSKKKVEREILIHKQLDHEHVAKFEWFFEDKLFVHILLELCPQKTLLHLSTYRKKISECELRYYGQQFISGINYIHSKGILHRDLKLGNMFLTTNMVVKIGDFGLATTFEGEAVFVVIFAILFYFVLENKCSSLCGTPNYIAPEVLDKQGHSTASDVWSVGCMVYALLCGTPPFQSNSLSTTYSLIAAADYSFPCDHGLSFKAMDFLNSTLSLNPGHRPSTSALLNHDLMTGPTPKFLPISALETPPDLSIFEDSSTLFLHRVITQLQNCQHNNNRRQYTTIPNCPVYVIKWVDYSNLFGFGYVLSDGCCGVMFVDGTKLSAASETTILYTNNLGVTRPVEENCSGSSEVLKRLQLLDYLSRYMEDHLDGQCKITDINNNENYPPQLLRWKRSDHYTTMQLSSKLVQINYLSDHLKIVLWQHQQDIVLTVVSSDSNMESYPLRSYCPPNIEIEEVTRLLKELYPALL